MLGFDEFLSESTAKSEHQVEGGLLLDVVILKGAFLLDVVVLKSAAVFELLSGKNESLLVWGDTLLVLDLGLHILDGVRLLDIKGDGLSSESLDEDLHSTSESEHEMESRLLLNVVVLEGSAVLELLSGEDQTLLVWRDSFLVLNLGLDVFDRIGLLNVESDGFPGEGLHENLHVLKKLESFVVVFNYPH